MQTRNAVAGLIPAHYASNGQIVDPLRMTKPTPSELFDVAWVKPSAKGCTPTRASVSFFHLLGASLAVRFSTRATDSRRQAAQRRVRVRRQILVVTKYAGKALIYGQDLR
jgi:hypothetical protein